MSTLDLLAVIVLGTSLWVLIDAANLKVRKGVLGGGFFDMGVAGWFFSCLLLWIVAFPAYLAKRGAYKPIAYKPIREEGGMATPSAIADLKTLADLRDRRILSAEEFEAKKAELLRRI